MLFDIIDCSVAVLQQCTTLTSAKHSADPAPFRWIIYLAAFQEPFCTYILPDAVLALNAEVRPPVWVVCFLMFVCHDPCTAPAMLMESREDRRGSSVNATNVTWSSFVEYIIIFGKGNQIDNGFLTYESKEISIIFWSYQKLFQSPGMGIDP